MKKDKLQATHEGELFIGNFVLKCCVLNNKQRIVNRSDFLAMLGSSVNMPLKSSEAILPLTYATTKQNKSTIQLLEKLKNPIRFLTRKGIPASGYEGVLITEYCKAVLRARKWGFITADTPRTYNIANVCEDIVVALANVGIIALIDEGARYQRVRADDELQKILDSYLAKYLGPWEKRFQDEFYENLFRLKGWDWNSCKNKKKNKPQIVGKITKDIVYSRMAPGLIDELEKLNPITCCDKRAAKHHQWLTPSAGQIALRGHLYGIIALMKCSTTWHSFYQKLQAVYPCQNEQMELRLWDEYEH